MTTNLADWPAAKTVSTQFSTQENLLPDIADCKRGFDLDYYITVDGVAIVPLVREMARTLFVLPAGAEDVRLVSPAWSPRQMNVATSDDRTLGLQVQGLFIGDLTRDRTAVPLEDSGFGVGFHPVERHSDGFVFRWTNGEARLAASLWEKCVGAPALELVGNLAPLGPRAINVPHHDKGVRASPDISMMPNLHLLLGAPSPHMLADTPIYIRSDGNAIAPLVRSHNEIAFLISAGTQNISLVSPTFTPRDADPANPDDRTLGLLVESLSIRNLAGDLFSVELTDERLIDGFYPLERALEGCFRWTNGNAHLAAGLWSHCADAFVLVVRGQFQNAATSPTSRALALRFENLGCDCEFGIVQRLVGAEPLNLLRWAGVPFRSLMNALEARLEGLGSPQTTEMKVGERDEYYACDTRWGFKLHTFAKQSEHSYDRLFPKVCQHIAYLRDKLIGDLQSAEKLFLYKHDQLAMWELRALHDMLRQFGPVRLLHIRRERATNKESSALVEQVRPDLYVGRLRSGAYASWDIRIKEWLEICEKVEGECRAALARG